jgi:chromosome segregation ATPase
MLKTLEEQIEFTKKQLNTHLGFVKTCQEQLELADKSIQELDMKLAYINDNTKDREEYVKNFGQKIQLIEYKKQKEIELDETKDIVEELGEKLRKLKKKVNVEL